MDSGFDAIVAAPFGRLGIRCADAGIASIDFLEGDSPLQAPRTPLAAQAAAALEGYLADPRAPLQLPLVPAGSDFQRRVWALMRAIPLGEARSYGSVAAELGSSARAVGGACRANPVPIVVPCHRIVGVTSLGGFNGASGGHELDVKRWLLAHEGFHKQLSIEL